MSSSTKTVYNSAGMIVRTVSLLGDDPIGDALIEDIPIGGGSVEGDYDSATVYFVAGVPTARPAVTVDPEYEITANGVDSVTFDIPDGTQVAVVSLEERHKSVDGSTSCVTDIADGDDSYTFKTKRRGEWELSIDPPDPYQSATVLVRAI